MATFVPNTARPPAKSTINIPLAVARHAFVELLLAMETTVKAERELADACHGETVGMFDPAMSRWLHDAEVAFERITNTLNPACKKASELPNGCPLRSMVFLMKDIFGSETPHEFAFHRRRATRHVAATVGTCGASTLERDRAQVIAAALPLLDAMEELGLFPAGLTDPSISPG